MGSHRYVRFCVDGIKYHSTGTFNQLYEEKLDDVVVGEMFPFEKFGIPNVLFGEHMILQPHYITLIFIKCHSACRAYRTIELICEFYIVNGIVCSKCTKRFNNVIIKKPYGNHDILSLDQFNNFLKGVYE